MTIFINQYRPRDVDSQCGVILGQCPRRQIIQVDDRARATSGDLAQQRGFPHTPWAFKQDDRLLAHAVDHNIKHLSIYKGIHHSHDDILVGLHGFSRWFYTVFR